MIEMNYVPVFFGRLFAEQPRYFTMNVNGTLAVRPVQVQAFIPGGQRAIEQFAVLMHIFGVTGHPAEAGHSIFFPEVFPSGELKILPGLTG
jgi:hypothetical protein